MDRRQSRGASRELFRKAAVYAADDGAELRLTERHVYDALPELLVKGGDLTRSVLAFRAPRPAAKAA